MTRLRTSTSGTREEQCRGAQSRGTSNNVLSSCCLSEVCGPSCFVSRRLDSAFVRVLGVVVCLTSTYLAAVGNKLFKYSIGNAINVSTHQQSTSDSWPMSLSSLIADTEANITAPVDWILQFAHIGMPKTASTSIMQLLYSHPEIQMYDHEISSLQNAIPAQLVKEMYELPPGRHFQRGYKSPGQLERIYCVYAFEKYFFNTRLIIGVRHPIWWFQSWFNFRLAQNRLQNEESPMIYMDSTLLPQSLEFHKNIAQLGKTNPSSAEEQALLGSFPRPIPKRYYLAHEKLNLSHAYMPKLDNKVFLYAEEQLNEKDTLLPVFLSDLQSFLNLSIPLGELPHYNTQEMHVSGDRIDICWKEYEPLRESLTELGSNMADWILQYFVPLKDEVVVSSPKQFRKLLLQWKEDPCIIRTGRP